MPEFLRNLGTAAGDLDAEVSGLARVDGPAAWFWAESGVGNGTQRIGPITTVNGPFSSIEYRAAVTVDDWLAFRLPVGWSASDELRVASSGALTMVVASAGVTSVVPGLPVNEPVTIRSRYEDGVGYEYGYMLGVQLDADAADFTPIANSSGTPHTGTVSPGTSVFLNRAAASVSRWMTLHGATVEADDVRLVTFDAAADISDPAAAAVPLTSGQSADVERDASGPVTTLVPAGTVVYINPDETDLANDLTAEDPAFDIGATESAWIAWTGQLNNGVDGAGFATFSTGRPSAVDDSVSIETGAVLNDALGGRVRNNGVTERGANTGLAAPIYKTLCCFVVLDRTAGEMNFYAYDDAGLVHAEITAWAQSAEPLVQSVPARWLEGVPATHSSSAFNRGVGAVPTDEERSAIARRFLANANRPARHTTGALPPVGHKVYGDRYRADNGHIAFFNGAAWEAETPTSGNLAALLGNNQLLLGAS